MRRFKLFLTLLVMITFCLSLNVEALETDSSTRGTTDPNSYLVTDVGDITVTGMDDEYSDSTDVWYAVKILNVFYNENTNVVTYEFTSGFEEFLSQNSVYSDLTVEEYMKLTSGDITSGSVVTNSTFDELISAYVNEGVLISDDDPTATIDDNDALYFFDVEAGAYLIVGSGTTTKYIYSVMVGNVIPVANDSTWEIQSATIVAKRTSVTASLYIDSIGNLITDRAVSYGETVKIYAVMIIPKLPTNDSEKTIKFTFRRFPKLLSINIKDGDEILTLKHSSYVNTKGYTVAELTWVDGNNVLIINTEELTNNVLTIEANCEIQGSQPTSIKNFTGRLDSAYAIISRPSSTSYFYIDTDVIKLYTYGIYLKAYKDGNKSLLMANATFDVYEDEKLTKKIGTITTDSNGVGFLAGVKDGTYYIKQTKTAAGYSLAPLTSMKVNITGSVPNEENDIFYNVEINVPKAGLLPFTGGIGTIIYTVIGLSIIIGTVVIYTMYKKKNKK